MREIEIPGVAYQSDDEDDEQSEDEDLGRPRPKSLFIPRDLKEPLTPLSSQPVSPGFLSATSRKRSNSLPSPATSTFLSPSKRSKASQKDVATPEEMAEHQDQKPEKPSHDQESQEPIEDPTEEHEKAQNTTKAIMEQ